MGAVNPIDVRSYEQLWLTNDFSVADDDQAGRDFTGDLAAERVHDAKADRATAGTINLARPCSVRNDTVLATNASVITSPPVAAASSYGTTVVVAAAPRVVATIVTEGNTDAVAAVVPPIIGIPAALIRKRTGSSLIV